MEYEIKKLTNENKEGLHSGLPAASRPGLVKTLTSRMRVRAVILRKCARTYGMLVPATWQKVVRTSMVVLKKKAGRRGRARERSRGVITAARK